jgi:hypothetical protein
VALGGRIKEFWRGLYASRSGCAPYRLPVLAARGARRSGRSCLAEPHRQGIRENASQDVNERKTQNGTEGAIPHRGLRPMFLSNLTG